MTADETRRVFFSGIQPIPVSDVNASLGDFTTEERRDGPADAASSSSGGRRTVHGEPLPLSHIEMIEATACHSWLWDYAETLEKDLDDMPSIGRPREHTVFEALLFEMVAGQRGNCRETARTFADPKTWQRLQDTLAQAWPWHPRRRLSNKPISREQHHRFRERHLPGDTVNDFQQIVGHIVLNAGSHIGLLTAEAGSVSHPATTQFITGDGTWIPCMYKNGPRQIINPKTGKVRRHDPDAVSYHTPTGEIGRGAYGQQAVLAIARGPHRNERLILDTGFKTPGKSDATVFCDMVLNMRDRHPHLRKGLRGVVYDMALHATDIDRFLDAGIIPVSKVQRTRGGKPAAINLGKHTFTNPKGNKTAAEVIALDGTPCIIVINETGTDSYMPLQRIRTRPNSHINRTTVYATWQVPDHPLTPPILNNATTLIRHNSTSEERKTGKRRTRALRVIPEGTDPDFDRVFGLRQDPESTNSHIKSLLRNGRARTVGTTRQTLNLIAHQVAVMTTALLAHHQRTGAPLHHWFGEHQPRVRAGPAKAA